MTLSAYLVVAALGGVGYRFYNADETPNGSRITAGIVDGGGGWYSAANVTPPGSAASVRWDSTSDPTLVAREYLVPAAAVVDTPGTTTLLSRIASVLTITGGKVDINDKTGFTVSDKTGFSLSPAYDKAKTAAQPGDVMAISSTQMTGIADEILKRDWVQVSGEAGFSMLSAMRAIRNVWSLSTSGLLTVFKEDGTTVSWQRSVRTDPTAKPIVGAD